PGASTTELFVLRGAPIGIGHRWRLHIVVEPGGVGVRADPKRTSSGFGETRNLERFEEANRTAIKTPEQIAPSRREERDRNGPLVPGWTRTVGAYSHVVSGTAGLDTRTYDVRQWLA